MGDVQGKDTIDNNEIFLEKPVEIPNARIILGIFTKKALNAENKKKYQSAQVS